MWLSTFLRLTKISTEFLNQLYPPYCFKIAATSTFQIEKDVQKIKFLILLNFRTDTMILEHFCFASIWKNSWDRAVWNSRVAVLHNNQVSFVRFRNRGFSQIYFHCRNIVNTLIPLKVYILTRQRHILPKLGAISANFETKKKKNRKNEANLDTAV